MSNDYDPMMVKAIAYAAAAEAGRTLAGTRCAERADADIEFARFPPADPEVIAGNLCLTDGASTVRSPRRATHGDLAVLAVGRFTRQSRRLSDNRGIRH